MLKSIFTLALLSLSAFTFAQKTGNYVVVINNDSIQINLDESFQYKPGGGKQLDIKVIQPNILTYTDAMISFNYDKSLNVSNTIIDKGIEQCMVMQSTGNGFMIQKYQTIDPSSLTQLMLNELIKESVSYGYVKKETPFKKTLQSGQTIEGIQATLSYKGEDEIYTVATYGAKDEGIIVITMLLSEDFNDEKIIDLFLNTLRIK
tara:strand:- start:13521 stop:14132 length:612 start_codon:yes stop_codon:yes gene_type:complete